MSLSALAGSAFSSTYMWHTPSACPSVGMRVDAMMCCTMALLPRGITRSIAPCSLSSAPIWARDSTNPSREPLTRPCVARSTVEARIECRTAFVREASLPPLSSNPLPEAMARAATCGTTSGLDSKMTSTTPIGTVSCLSTSPGASSTCRLVRHRGSGWEAMARSPAVTPRSFCKGSSRRAAEAALMLLARAAWTSAPFAFAMDSKPASNASAHACSTAPRSAWLSFCSARLASRAATAAARAAGSSGGSGGARGGSGAAGLAACSAAISSLASLSVRRSVPSASPLRMRSTPKGSKPEKMTTADTPRSSAVSAASTLACMPPLPRADLAPKESGVDRVTTGRTSGGWPGSGGPRKMPGTSEPNMSTSDLSSVATSTARESLSENSLRRSGTDRTSFSLMTGTVPTCSMTSSVERTRRRRASEEKSRSVTSTWPHVIPYCEKSVSYSPMSPP
mmetsp:Transcript_33242/g.106046  ORF Transcript_33242/g.106046 Transcript_33242/m.106046 type:complete len:452 (-) Transcript_33242:397-1752(-)